MTTAFKLRNGTILLSTEAPGGIYNAAQLKKIASLCEGDVAIVKATEDQRLALCVKPEQANTIANELKSIGLGIRHYQDGLHHPTSCIGELCPDHEQDALGSALDVSQQLEAIKLASPLKIGINGCARCCVPCHTLDISVVGDAAGYRMHLGGKNSQLPEMASFMADGIPAPVLPGLILKVIELYQSHAQPAESLQDVIERVGSTQFIDILSPYSQDAAGDADPFAGTDAVPNLEESSESVETSSELNLDDGDQDLELTPELIPVGDTETSMEEFTASDELAPSEDHGDLSTDDLSLIENETLSMEAMSDDVMSDMDLSAISHDKSIQVDINPSSDGMGDLDAEVAISDTHTSAHDISLSDDFGEDTIDSPPTTDDSSILVNADLDLDELPETELAQFNADEEISESVIDVSDVMKNTLQPPIAEATPNEEFESLDMPDLTLNEADIPAADAPVDEDAYERQLNASIAAQEQLVDHSNTDEEREQALDVLNDSDASLDEGAFSEENTGTGEALADDASMISDSIEDLNSAPLEDLELETLDEFEELESVNPHDHLPLSEVVGTKPANATPIRPAAPKKTAASWAFAGFDVDADSNPILSFANGVQITLTEEAVANGSITIGGRHIMLASINGGIEIQMDGMRLFLPKAA